MQESDDPQHTETVLLLAQCISKLPSLQRKVLAMYYFENVPLADIAISLGLSKIKTCQILVETYAQLLLTDRRIPSLKDRQTRPDPEADSVPDGMLGQAIRATNLQLWQSPQLKPLKPSRKDL